MICERKMVYRQEKTRHSCLSSVKILSEELLNSGQVCTAEAYHCSVRRLLAFTGKQHLGLKDIGSVLIKRFERQLLKEKKLNTISFYMRNLRAILFKAVRKIITYKHYRICYPVVRMFFVNSKGYNLQSLVEIKSKGIIFLVLYR